MDTPAAFLTPPPRRNMTAAELLDVTEVERLALRPGDLVVLKVSKRLDDCAYKELTNRLRAAIPLPTKILILEDGADISVLRAADDGEQGGDV